MVVSCQRCHHRTWGMRCGARDVPPREGAGVCRDESCSPAQAWAGPSARTLTRTTPFLTTSYWQRSRCHRRGHARRVRGPPARTPTQTTMWRQARSQLRTRVLVMVGAFPAAQSQTSPVHAAIDSVIDGYDVEQICICEGASSGNHTRCTRAVLQHVPVLATRWVTLQ
jgi:hypothetical protein